MPHLLVFESVSCKSRSQFTFFSSNCFSSLLSLIVINTPDAATQPPKKNAIKISKEPLL